MLIPILRFTLRLLRYLERVETRDQLKLDRLQPNYDPQDPNPYRPNRTRGNHS